MISFLIISMLAGLNDPVSSSDAVNKEYADSELALAVNELTRKINSKCG